MNFFNSTLYAFVLFISTQLTCMDTASLLDKNHYEVLQVPCAASALEIKRAYKSLALQYHPDAIDKNYGPLLKNSEISQTDFDRAKKHSESAFKKISEAYRVLIDTQKRADYDFMRINIPFALQADCQEQNGQELFHWIKTNNLEAVKNLLKKTKVNLNWQDSNGRTALALAAGLGNAEITKFFIAARANPNIANKIGLTPLMEAAWYDNAEVVAGLLASGALPNMQNSLGFTALMRAAREGHKSVVVTLLAAGANPELTNKMCHSAYDLALNENKPEIAQLLQDACSKRRQK